MTHTFMYVICPKSVRLSNRGAIERAVEKLMAPFLEEDCYEKGEDGEMHQKPGSNPRWDWYVIGGRWTGQLAKEDACLVQDSKLGFVPSDILTPDGEWHADGRAGWFGIREHRDGAVSGPFDEKHEGQQWDHEARTLLKQYKDHVLVGVDYHV